jgi:hypothetical protein
MTFSLPCVSGLVQLSIIGRMLHQFVPEKSKQGLVDDTHHGKISIRQN